MKILHALSIAAGLAVASFTFNPASAAPLGATGAAIGHAAQSPAVSQVRFGGGFHGGGFHGGGFHGGGFRGGWGGRGWGGRGWGYGGLGLGLATGALLGSGYYYGYPAYYPGYYAAGSYYDDEEPVYYAPRRRAVYRAGAAPCRIVSHGHVYHRAGCR